MRVGLIGLGGMGKVVLQSLSTEQESSPIQFVGALVSARDYAATKESHGHILPVHEDFSALLKAEPQVIAECAGHEAVRAYGEKILQSGIDLLIISTGVLADEELFERLKRAATENDTSIYLPAGAVGGIDALGAARMAGLKHVTYKAIKPALAWKGTPAEDSVDLDSIKTSQCFYTGTAREAALLYPKNSNVAATVALAGAGFDQTRVELEADPELDENKHEIQVEAESGSFTIRLSGLPLKDSPKTSALAAYSVAKCLKDLNNTIKI